MRSWLLLGLVTLGPIQANAHDVDGRMAELARWIESDPANGAALLERARLLRLEGDPAAAYVDADRAVTLTHGASDTRAERGLCLERLGHDGRALPDLDKALDAMPADPDLREARARIRARQGRLVEALSDLDAALASRADPDLFLQRSRLIARTQGPIAAARSLREAHQKTGAFVLAEEADRLEAESVGGARDAVARHPSDPEALLGLGRALLKTGRSTEARAAFAKALEAADERCRARETALCQLVRAKVLAEMGRREKALEAGRVVLESSPGWAEAESFVRQMEQGRMR